MARTRMDELIKEMGKVAVSITQYEKQLGELMDDGISPDEQDKMDEVLTALNEAVDRFGTLVNEMKRTP